MARRFSRRNLLEASTLFASPALLCDACKSETRAASPARDVRSLTTSFAGLYSVDGAGVRLRRSIGSRALSLLDPFLLLDEIHSDVPADYLRGFPSHPHRGFETVTYMIEGAMEHRDSVGNHGHLGPGSAQWMTAGHGIIHSEMPRSDSNTLWGLQLWVNLPAQQKLVRPRYQDIDPRRIPELGVRGARLRVVAGRWGAERGPVDGIAVEPTLFDVTLPARGTFEYELESHHTLFAYLLSGSARFGNELTALGAGSLAVFAPGNVLVAKSDAGGRFLLVAGRALNEPVARRGPFVMNTQEELEQAYADYASGRLTES